jgi:hypothetical protein
VSFAFGFLAKAAAGFVAAQHATHQGTGEGDGGIGELLDRWTKRLRVCRRCSVEGFMGVCFFPLFSFIYTYERHKAQQNRGRGTELITRELQKFLTGRLQDNHFTSETFENCKTLA